MQTSGAVFLDNEHERVIRVRSLGPADGFCRALEVTPGVVFVKWV